MCQLRKQFITGKQIKTAKDKLFTHQLAHIRNVFFSHRRHLDQNVRLGTQLAGLTGRPSGRVIVLAAFDVLLVGCNLHVSI